MGGKNAAQPGGRIESGKIGLQRLEGEQPAIQQQRRGQRRQKRRRQNRRNGHEAAAPMAAEQTYHLLDLEAVSGGKGQAATHQAGEAREQLAAQQPDRNADCRQQSEGVEFVRARNLPLLAGLLEPPGRRRFRSFEVVFVSHGKSISYGCDYWRHAVRSIAQTGGRLRPNSAGRDPAGLVVRTRDSAKNATAATFAARFSIWRSRRRSSRCTGALHPFFAASCARTSRFSASP